MKQIIFSLLICLLACGTLSVAAEETAKEAVKEIKSGDNLPEPTDKKAVIVDFNASWCMPCRMFKPAFDRAAKQYGDKAVFVSIDIDANTELAKSYGVKSIPYVVVMRKGQEPVTHIGAMSYDDFCTFLDDALN